MQERQTKLPNGLIAYTVLFGVLLPIMALLVEISTGVNQHAFFNPIPTPIHSVLIATVPLANALFALALIRGQINMPRWQAWLNGFAIGVATVYSLLFLPMTPFAPFAIIWFGIGLLPLAPLLSLLAAVGTRHRLKAWTRESGQPAWPPLWAALLLSLSTFVVIDLPATLTRVGLHMAASDETSTRLTGLRWLRAVGNEPLMLRLCYDQSGVSTDMIGALLETQMPLNTSQTRQTFYRATGTPFNDLPRPMQKHPRDWNSLFDADRGGEAVGGKASGVSLASSRIDGSIDADAALSYLEWTMVFHNKSPADQEARTEITLPPGAVVSRVTLWINGEEREAAFGGRAQVRQAYEKVVKQQRDPVLVTTSGQDRVLVQLFPVPSLGDMKVRIGITAPMTMPGAGVARLQLPSFTERNFDITEALRHNIWIESTTELLDAPGLHRDEGKGVPHALRGDVPELLAFAVGARRSASLTNAWSSDTRSDDNSVVVQTISSKEEKAPRRVAIVIDGSASMKANKEQLVAAMSQVPASIELALVIAGDGKPEIFTRDTSAPTDFIAHLARFDFVGGRDNSEALAAAWDWVAESSSDGQIVWAHGPQPNVDMSIEHLIQRLQRRPGQVELSQLEAVAGHDEISKKLDGLATMQRIPREGKVGEDLATYFSQWRPGATSMHVERKRSDSRGMTLAKTSDHLVRLWAAEQVNMMIARHTPEQRAAATALALRYQLVTPVTGAVVLETKADYDAAGLEPVPPGSVPTLPEPETWAMLGIALALLGWRYRNRRRYQAREMSE